MDTVVMAGGKGTRLDAPVEKPLFEVGGKPMIDSVLDAVAGSQTDRIVVAVSPATPDTKAHLAEYSTGGEADIEIVETAGEGYVEDLDDALGVTGTPTLTVAADLPLLDSEPIDRVIDAAAEADGSLSVCVPAPLKRQLGVSVDMEIDGLAPTGLNVVADKADTMYVSYDARFAVNVNRHADARVAEALEWE